MVGSYHMQIAGCERALKRCPLNDKIDIAAFIMFGDVEITIKASEELLRKVPEFDIILTAECKSIPLAYEMARQSGKPYIVARKSEKVYMSDVIAVTVNSITTRAEQRLCLDGEKALALKGKRVLIVDDVISLGDSLRALEDLVALSDGCIVGKAFVLAEGEAADREDILYLEKLPLFFKDER